MALGRGCYWSQLLEEQHFGETRHRSGRILVVRWAGSERQNHSWSGLRAPEILTGPTDWVHEAE